MSVSNPYVEPLRRHAASIDIPRYPELCYRRPRFSRGATTALCAVAALLFGAPALAQLLSYYADDNASVRRLAERASSARHAQVLPDSIVSASAPKAEQAMRRRGYRVVRSATFGSGSTAVEISTAAGFAVVVVRPKDAKSLLLIPQGRTVHFFKFRNSTVGAHTVTVDSTRAMSDVNFRKIVASAIP